MSPDTAKTYLCNAGVGGKIFRGARIKSLAVSRVKHYTFLMTEPVKAFSFLAR